MTKIMNICDSVTTSTVWGRRPHFRDALIGGEHTLFYTNLGLFHNNTPPPMFPTKIVRILCLIKIHKN